jgi:hypothetical protein
VRFIRWIQPFLWVASALAVAYTAWVFTGRVFERKKLNQRTQQQAANPEFERLYGGDTVRILQFYARDGAISRGQSTLLCYGVLNATSVRLSPALDGVYPSAGRCLEISPAQTTTYQITAEGPKGPPVSGSLKVVVHSAGAGLNPQ